MIDLIKNIRTCMRLKKGPLNIERWGYVARWDCYADKDFWGYKKAKDSIYSSSKIIYNILSRWNVI